MYTTTTNETRHGVSALARNGLNRLCPRDTVVAKAVAGQRRIFVMRDSAASTASL